MRTRSQCCYQNSRDGVLFPFEIFSKLLIKVANLSPVRGTSALFVPSDRTNTPSLSVSIRLIYGLGIPKIGEQTARDIAAVFENDFNAFWIYVKTEAGPVPSPPLLVPLFLTSVSSSHVASHRCLSVIQAN
jgi:hypothetical protein